VKTAWHTFEGPTWLVAAAIYGGWVALALGYRHLSLALVVPCAIFLTAWHSSLQHETIHAMRRVPPRLRAMLATPPLGVFYPYEWYRSEHARHHATNELGSPSDPESFAFDAARVEALSPPLRMILSANATLAGRLVFGPAIHVVRTYRAAFDAIRAGDVRTRNIWRKHILFVIVLLAALRFEGVHPIAYLAFVAYPAASLGLIRSFAEHRPAVHWPERTAIVESRSLLSLLFLNNNLHATHHALPSLPWYELPARYDRDRRTGALSPDTPRLRGYRQVARSWLLRPLTSPDPAAESHETRSMRIASSGQATTQRPHAWH
jgi:fatty acid desaturase